MAKNTKQLIVSRFLAPSAMRHFFNLKPIIDKEDIVTGYKNITEVEEIIIDDKKLPQEFEMKNISKDEQKRISDFFRQ